MSYYVYVLKSLKDDIRYIGSAQNVEKRLAEHTRGKQQYTKGHVPWELVYQEECSSRSEASKKERFFKSTTGRRRLDELLKI